ncbi:MAG: pyridoxamine 5'-phosphate oxidase [Rickettsiales bacterium]|jgi:pyridoxamine 5'-phosphate oxidase
MNNHQEPFDIFSKWIKIAQENSKIIEPTAMCLATVDKENRPSSRMILLKKFDEKGFCFFTNLNGRKAGELKNNQNVALCFYWGVLGRQIRIEGSVENVTQKEADDYFSSRQRGSQIGAWASKQSEEMANDQEFAQRIEKFEKEFAEKDVSRPPFWSGFRCIPSRIEFWEEGEFRLHKRTIYQKSGDSWIISNIYP